MLRVAASFSFAALLISSGAGAATIVVANNSDAVNGDTRSPSALAQQPEPDGVSLREAIESANLHEPDMLNVLASRFRMSGLRFRNIKHRAVVVQAGPVVGESADGPQEIRDVSISGNVFDTTGFTSGDEFVDAIRVWIDVLVDPLVIDAAGGNLRLRAGSPAIDQATAEAPIADADCGARVGPADIGAYEFGALPVARLTIETAGSGGGNEPGRLRVRAVCGLSARRHRCPASETILCGLVRPPGLC